MTRPRAIGVLICCGLLLVGLFAIPRGPSDAQPQDDTLTMLSTALLSKYPSDQAPTVAQGIITAAQKFHDENPDVSLEDAEVTNAILAGLPEYRARQIFD